MQKSTTTSNYMTYSIYTSLLGYEIAGVGIEVSVMSEFKSLGGGLVDVI